MDATRTSEIRVSNGGARQVIRDPQTPAEFNLASDLIDARTTLADRDAEIATLRARVEATEARAAALQEGIDRAYDAMRVRNGCGHCGADFLETGGKHVGSCVVPEIEPLAYPSPEEKAPGMAMLEEVIAFRRAMQILAAPGEAYVDAATRIGARVEAMGAALHPFADLARGLNAALPDEHTVMYYGKDGKPLTAGAFRACQPHSLDRAAAVLAAARDPLVIKALEFWIFCAEHDTSGSLTSLENYGRIPAAKALVETLRALDAKGPPAGAPASSEPSRP